MDTYCQYYKPNLIKILQAVSQIIEAFHSRNLESNPNPNFNKKCQGRKQQHYVIRKLKYLLNNHNERSPCLIQNVLTNYPTPQFNTTIKNRSHNCSTISLNVLIMLETFSKQKGLQIATSDHRVG